MHLGFSEEIATDLLASMYQPAIFRVALGDRRDRWKITGRLPLSFAIGALDYWMGVIDEDCPLMTGVLTMYRCTVSVSESKMPIMDPKHKYPDESIEFIIVARPRTPSKCNMLGLKRSRKPLASVKWKYDALCPAQLPLKSPFDT